MKTYKLKFEFKCGINEYRLLAFLYQKVLTEEAYKLIHVFYSLLIFEISLNDLENLLSINDEEIDKALDNLEIYGLIKKDLDIITFIKPLNIDDFSNTFNIDTSFASNLLLSGESYDFDFLEFENVTKYKLSDLEKEEISSLSYIYNLSFKDMISIFYESVKDEKLDLDLLKENVKSWNEYKNKKKYNNANTKEARINFFKNTSPKEVLNIATKSKVSKADLNIIERLYVELEMPSEVISVLMAYAIIMKDGIIPPYDYFEKIGLNWKSKGIKKAEEAYDYLNDLLKQKTKKETENFTIDWLKDYWEKETGGSK